MRLERNTNGLLRQYLPNKDKPVDLQAKTVGWTYLEFESVIRLNPEQKFQKIEEIIWNNELMFLSVF